MSPDPKAETRLYVTVNGFEFHVYNRTDLYARLQETFGLDPTLITPKREDDKCQEDRDKTPERYDRGARPKPHVFLFSVGVEQIKSRTNNDVKITTFGSMAKCAPKCVGSVRTEESGGHFPLKAKRIAPSLKKQQQRVPVKLLSDCLLAPCVV